VTETGLTKKGTSPMHATAIQAMHFKLKGVNIRRKRRDRVLPADKEDAKYQ
jgi:hypothetical protein